MVPSCMLSVVRTTFVWSVWAVVVLGPSVRGFKVYNSCADVQTDLGTNATDREYVIFLPNRVGVSVYCHGFHGTQPPVEYITLRAGRSSNFALFYENVGSPAYCADKFPRDLFGNRGRSEFSKIGINLDTLTVKTDDFAFANKTGLRNIPYGTAGDNYTSSAICTPMGTFQIDLTGTPFSVATDTRWIWTGQYYRGNITQGAAQVDNHVYLGCYRDRTERILPANRHDDTANQTAANCRSYCQARGYRFAGTEYGVECHCGNNYDKYGSPRMPESMCNKPCSGDPATMCGGTWYISIYATGVPQLFTGRCGGYPGQCFPTSTSMPTKQMLKLDIMNGEHPCIKKKPCLNEGRCIAVDSERHVCMCYPGYSGNNCETVNSVFITNGSTCPTGYQAEACSCQESRCIGAKFDGDTCLAATGNARVTCRLGEPSHEILFNIMGTPTAKCPDGAQMVGCSYWSSNSPNYGAHAQGVTVHGTCRACSVCQAYARCKQHVCGCKNGGHCNQVTGQCECPLSYYGEKCETFDYCAYYEDKHNHTTLCSGGGICRAVYKETMKAVAGDMAADTCIFPFDYGDMTFNTCVDENIIGPPFACAADFHQSHSYIDLGPWSPGPKYTIAAWVRPAIIDTIRRTVAGGVSDCNDFGFNLNSGTFRGFLKLSKECTRDLDAGKPLVSVGKWYMIAVTSNATHAQIYQNGELRETNTVLMNHLPTTAGFRIGGEVCCPNDFFHGMIKTVKAWNRHLTREEINTSMYNIGTGNTTTEAIYSGLVGHWELGDVGLPTCGGAMATDHGGEDWTLSDGQFISGIHCNISKFTVPTGVTVQIDRYNGTGGGKLEITAQEILINGYMDGTGAGYRGGAASTGAGTSGNQGESYSGAGTPSMQNNRGGGGGGRGGKGVTDGSGRSGGGGGYGAAGSPGVKTVGDRSGLGSGGSLYGDQDMNMLYLGSGGGSGGNARDLSTNPIGGRGGNGGGAIKLIADRSVIIGGVVSVSGESGQGDVPSDGARCMGCPVACDIQSPVYCHGNSTTACWDMSGPGGGGSGGSIYISGKLANIGYQKLWALGGDGGHGGGHCCGGSGGMGRIRVDSVIMKGVVGNEQGILKTTRLQDKIVDHTQTGQKQIDYTTTKYGNEVYRGCFREISTIHRKMAITIATTATIRAKMTPQYCQLMCRAKNYMFSGTQNTNECYCDNHLDMSNKAPDSDCNLACQGDPLWKCGGTNRLQIFGPPPGAPAIGYNVVPTCQSWCVTADPNTPKPKWGLCAGDTVGVANWDVKCECPPGKTGDNCAQLCPEWTYGVGCRRNCTCNLNNTAECTVSTGTCNCQPGFHGKDCQTTCSDGYFGENCAKTCNCSNNAKCDHVTGVCTCRAGWSGLYCNFPCPRNKFGPGCNQTCECNHGSCSPEDDTCDCDPGYTLPNCYERCDPYNYGQNCALDCGSKCNGQPCEAVTGRCQCGPGYIGPKCEIMCPHGTYDQGCAKQCPCDNGFGCDHVTGECNCGAGWEGESCGIACQYGRYGFDCASHCSCVMNQTSACDAINGACICLDGYRGVNCEQTCPTGFYGFHCRSMCNCLNGAACNPSTGKCTCSPGFTGDRCDQSCPSGSYGPMCVSRCLSTCLGGRCNIVDGTCTCPTGTPCTCANNTWGTPPLCSNVCACVNGACDQTTGHCTCAPGWIGTYCQQSCPTGKFGQNCQSACTCVEGTCDPTTGTCTCSPGYKGPQCDIKCANKTYGPGCIFQCTPCGPYSYPGCDVKAGTCLCSDGYTGSFCDRPCKLGMYGTNCSSTCSCQNGAICDGVTGKCICPAGFTGDRCQNVCPFGRWGENCSRKCDCGIHGNGCSPDEGVCRCKPGFTGVKCRQSCGTRTYGQNCSSVCLCHAQSSVCSPIDGSCLCAAGYSGEHCQQVCPPGFWGVGCSQACQCNGRGFCNPRNGQCDCMAGYTGTRCQQQYTDEQRTVRTLIRRRVTRRLIWGHTVRTWLAIIAPGSIWVNPESCQTISMYTLSSVDCPENVYWGKNCANLCSCYGHHCDPTDGSCRCPPGKTGHSCEQDCDSTHFGFQCAQLCGCQNNALCDHVTGACRCQPGWSGRLCTENCPTGMYGVDCSQACPDCQNGGTCDSFSGVCLCLPAFTGQYCNTSLVAATKQHVGYQKLESQTGIHFTTGQLSGLIVGFLIALVIVAIVAVVVTRKRYVGRFGNAEGVTKFVEDEVDLRPGEVHTMSSPGAAGFVNPVHEELFKETTLDKTADSSVGNPDGASCMVDEHTDDTKYFKDSSA